MRGNIPISELPLNEEVWLMVLVTSVRERRTQQGKPLLYQLSYVGAEQAKHCIRWRLTQAVCCSGFAAHEELKRPRRLDFSGGVCDARAPRVS